MATIVLQSIALEICFWNVSGETQREFLKQLSLPWQISKNSESILGSSDWYLQIQTEIL